MGVTECSLSVGFPASRGRGQFGLLQIRGEEGSRPDPAPARGAGPSLSREGPQGSRGLGPLELRDTPTLKNT